MFRTCSNGVSDVYGSRTHKQTRGTYPLRRRNRSEITRPIKRVTPRVNFVNRLYKLGFVPMKSTGIIRKTCNFELILNVRGWVSRAIEISVTIYQPPVRGRVLENSGLSGAEGRTVGRQNNPLTSGVHEGDLLLGEHPRYWRVVHTYYRSSSICVCVTGCVCVWCVWCVCLCVQN